MATVNFRSDNVMGASPEVLEAIVAAARGDAHSYGADSYTGKLEARLAEIFEHELVVLPVATGTAANALCLAALTPPWGAIYGHAEAHALTDECGAPEMFSAGAKLVGLPGEHGRIQPHVLDEALAAAGKGTVHHVQPAALTITQATEAGTVYRIDGISALSVVAGMHEIKVHMDGARFANALVTLDCSPARMTWKAGIDMLSFGATKNGCLAAEAVISFDPSRRQELLFRRKRAGHLFSKARLLSAQLLAYLEGDLWLRNARHANAMAARLGSGLAALPGARLAHPVEANEVFVDLPEPAIAAVEAAGFGVYRWHGPGTTRLRLVTSFATDPADIDAFIATASRACAAAA